MVIILIATMILSIIYFKLVILGYFVVGLKHRKSIVRIVGLVFQNLQLYGYRLD